MPDLTDADPVAVLMDWLSNHPDAQTLLGGPGHVTGLNETPWPHATLSDGSVADWRNFTWEAELEVMIAVYSAPDGSPGYSALRRIALKLALLCQSICDKDWADTDPVISRVRPSGALVYSKLKTGQHRWQIGIKVTIRPPLALPPPPAV